MPALAPPGSPDAFDFLRIGEYDFEERVESHGCCHWVAAGPFVGIDELEDPFAVLLDNGPKLRLCFGKDEEHLLLQFFRPLDDVSDFFGVLLLDKEVLD